MPGPWELIGNGELTASMRSARSLTAEVDSSTP
jgi:hypothetical protein